MSLSQTKCALTVLVTLIVVAVGTAAAATGGFFGDYAIGTVVPAPATAYLTCYTVDAGFELVPGGTARHDVLSVLERRESDGRRTICYLRPPSPGGGQWMPELPTR